MINASIWRIVHVFRSQPLYAIVTLLSLTGSISIALMIYTFIRNELSFDRFHTAADRIYRVETNLIQSKEGKADWHMASLSQPLIERVRDEVPGLLHTTRWATDFTACIVRASDKSFSTKLTYVDTGFFAMFNFPIVKGQRSNPFSDQHAIVVTETSAIKYFGDADPMGQTITALHHGEEVSYQVAAVIHDPPPNSSLEFSFLVPMENFPDYDYYRSQWGEHNYGLFVELGERSNPTDFTNKLNHLAASARPFIVSPQDSVSLTATVLGEMHSNTVVEWPKAVNPQNARVLIGIVLMITTMACGNFIALSLASASRRRKEIGIKKISGASRARLMLEFIAEAVGFVALAVALGLLVVRIAMPYFNTMVGIDLRFSFDGQDMTFVLALLLVVGIAAGCYPAIVLSAFNPTEILKSHAVMKMRFTLVSTLVVLQALLSLFLGTSAHVMSRQMRFLNEVDLGFNHDQVVVLPLYNERFSELDEGARIAARFKAEAATVPDIISTAAASGSFFKDVSRMGVNMKFKEPFSCAVYCVDTDFVGTLGLRLREGRNFSPGIASDTMAVMVNQVMADIIGDHPIGTTFSWGMRGKAEVIGVIDDFHDRSLEFPTTPMFLSLDSKQLSPAVLNIKVRGGNVPATLARIEAISKKVNPDKPFEPEFLSAMVQAQYQSYKLWTQLISFATLFATLIACVGLFALAGIETSTRYREIGIRKVFGASTGQILIRVSQRYVYLVLGASAVAVVVSFWVMSEWVKQFAYRVTLDGFIYAEAVTVGVCILIMATVYHCVVASRTNPAVVLKGDG